MTHRISATIVAAAFVFASGLALAQDGAVSPFIGAWKMNVAKSKFEGTPPVKSYSITITDAGDGKTHNLAQWVDSDGTKGQAEYTTKADGKASPVTGYPNADSVRSTSTGPRSSKMSLLKAGKVVEWGKYTVSSNGKSMLGTEGGTDAEGAKYKWTEVFERQ
ncbi:MAG TPA: hypothetical protein VGO37_19850 [Steroidobacteraceae bacterium]|jgi:hypothetical protein|nr:hypothetical protein [Steroidobacteraceae bacterium]